MLPKKNRVNLLFLAAFIFIATVFLVPSFLIAEVKENLIFERIADAKKSFSAENKDEVRMEVSEINSMLSVLSKDILSPDLFGSLSYILGKRPRGVFISSIYFDQSGGNDAKQFTVRGTADDRDTLITFAADLKKESKFAEVRLPVGDLAKSEELSFTITIRFR